MRCILSSDFYSLNPCCVTRRKLIGLWTILKGHGASSFMYLRNAELGEKDRHNSVGAGESDYVNVLNTFDDPNIEK